MAMDENDKRLVEQMVQRAIQSALQYKTRKYGDTPSDVFHLVPLSYTDLATPTVTRPASVFSPGLSQSFFNTTTGIPNWFNPNSSVWVSATGSTVAGN